MTTFAQLGVPSPIVAALAARGIHEPFPIQAAAIADALDDRDVCGRAPTGSGKTLAFGIPLVASTPRAEPKRPRSLVLAPTRELADQITTELRTFAGDVRVGVVYGGVGYQPQVNALRRGVDILVACPGRLEDLIDQGLVDLGDVDRVVLDEADRMADMGFLPAVRRLLDQTARDRQTVLFSATLDGDVAALTRDHQRDPVRHEVGATTPDITSATHLFWTVEHLDRIELTAQLVDASWPAIVFCRTRHGADRVAKRLGRSGIVAAPIHGGRSQNQRTRALADFSKGKVSALVATDVAARGIHVDGVACVVHFDPPEDHKAYVHRSGRTARAGETGLVVSLVQPQQSKDVRRMQRDAGLDEPITAPDLVAVAARSATSGSPTGARSHTARGTTDDRSAGTTRRGDGRAASGSEQPRQDRSRQGRSRQDRSTGAEHRDGGPQRNGGPKRDNGSRRRGSGGATQDAPASGGGRSGQSRGSASGSGGRYGQPSRGGAASARNRSGRPGQRTRSGSGGAGGGRRTRRGDGGRR